MVLSGFKILVLDKSVFIKTHIQNLCDFVKRHFVVLPWVLLEECYTNPDKNNLLDRYQKILKAGGYTCPRSEIFIQREGQNLCPHNFIPDLKLTEAIRKNSRTLKQLITNDDIKKEIADRQKQVKSLEKLVIRIANGMQKSHPDSIDLIRKTQSNKSLRYREFIKYTNGLDIHKLAEIHFSHYTFNPRNFCLSNEWMTWHYIRLFIVRVLEYTYRKQTGIIPSKNHIEHDLQDLEYIFLLCRSIGLLTEDKESKALSQAAFPDKKIFSNIKEVSDEYLCHWN